VFPDPTEAGPARWELDDILGWYPDNQAYCKPDDRDVLAFIAQNPAGVTRVEVFVKFRLAYKRDPKTVDDRLERMYKEEKIHTATVSTGNVRKQTVYHTSATEQNGMSSGYNHQSNYLFFFKDA
jgi:hypothetical protein